MYRVRVFAFLLTLGTIAQTRDLKIGRISGQVVSQEGKPVANAQVTAALQTGGPTVRVDRWGMTDDEGRFVIDHLAFGKYAMVAEKPSDGYPQRLLWGFYGPERSPIVMLTEASPSAEVDIELPPKAGNVIVMIVNAKAGLFIPAGVQISSRDGTYSLRTGVDENDTVQIPSGVDVDLTIEAAGYGDWSYSDTHDGAPLNLKPDERVVLTIKLASLNGH